MTDQEPTAIPVNPAFEREFRTLLRSGQQLISISGCAEMYRARRCIQQIAQTAPKEPWTVFVWNPHRGFTWAAVDAGGNMRPIPFIEKGTESQYGDPMFALRRIPEIPPNTTGCSKAIFVFQNMHLHLDNLALRDQLQTMVDEGRFSSNIRNNSYKRLVVLLHPADAVHHEMRNYAVPVTFPPANELDMLHAIEYVGNSITGDAKDGCPDDLKSRMASSMLGLTKQQGEDVTAKCLAAKGGWHDDMLVLIEEAKAAQIGQDGYLTYVPPKDSQSLENIGGWDLAEQHVRRQCIAYTASGRAKKLKVPRGILLLGLPGTGKSAFAKLVRQIIYQTTGQAFPTYKLNYDALFGGIVGETETNVRRVLSILEAQRKYILVVDEMEKFLGTSGGENDGGVSRKASAKFLDWLSERSLKTDDEADFGYVIGTMNSTNGLAPEFFRRFDATFFVDLPTPDTRLEIIKIQLRLNHVDPESLRGEDGKKLRAADWTELVDSTADFSGSEIEQAVVLAREVAAEARPDDDAARPTFEELQGAIAVAGRSIMARVHAESIQQIRSTMKGRALPVHVETKVIPTASSARRGGRAIDTDTGT